MACAPALSALAPLGWSLVGAGLAAASDPGLLLPGGTLAAMGWSLAWAAAWAGCALVAAVPAAWWLAWQAPRRAAWVACLIAGPALVPGYVVLAGLRVGRAPGWWLGDALEGGPGWLSVWADRALAGLAQAVWLWPVMTLLLWPVLAGVTGEAVDAARSLGAGPARIMRLALGQARRGVAAVWLAGALVGLGSAVPAHLSGAPTLAARLWSELALRPSAEVWAGAWPVLLVAVAGAAWAAGLVWTSDGRGWQAGAPPRQWRAPGARSAALLGLGLPAAVWVGVLALMAVGVGRWAWLAGFVREHGGAAGQSGALALGVGVV
ncbi:MAG: hypothetical protein C0513_07460, partial [Isosphaera sp.]|nr:hypothetical protein [Isosphaera sp.]